jgi:hypothetical protein
MKHGILLLFVLFLFKTAIAQDDVKVTLTEEADTLVKQRFIDRYENVFMTKVPTRHMFKVGVSQYFQPIQFSLIDNRAINNASLIVGYEFKFLPAFSIALSGHLPFYFAEIPSEYIRQNIVGDVQLRWFYNMRQRIRSGKSANNFSGNYIALNYTTAGTVDLGENGPTIGIKAGYQRRFLNSGFMDFNLAFQQTDPTFRYGLFHLWSVTSQVSFGLAFGDWKKARKQPLCDLLRCDENLRNQFKVKLPEVTFGYHLNRIRLGAAYEHKIGASPFSLNFQYDINLNKGFSYSKREYDYNLYHVYGSDLTKEISQYFTLQPRYYLLQKRQQLTGAGGNGMSGFYTGINMEFYRYSGRHSVRYQFHTQSIKQNTLYTGVLIGFQQRLFRHGYLDFNTSYNFKREFYTSENATGFRGNLGLGFAF